LEADFSHYCPIHYQKLDLMTYKLSMKLGEALKKVREAKNLSQKELAGLLGMAQAQYSRIESGKTDPSFSAVIKIAKALGISLSELFTSDEIFKDVNAYDKTLLEKLRLIDSLDEVEKKSIYNIVDSLIAKKKLKDNLSNLVAG
jgi:transcriptional regulator with XRE-family HTH domain